MHVLMVTDAYSPMRTSCAVQMHDLAQGFIEEGHQVTVITPNSSLKENIRIAHKDGVRLVQVKAFKSKDINYIFRSFSEFINPFLIWHILKKCPEFLNTQYNGIIWYSPTIFWGPLIKRLKGQYKVKTYLILRDIFPDWALDLGLIKKGIIYKFLKVVESFQYQQADIIGVQSPNNLRYFKNHNPRIRSRVEVLWNWIGKVKETKCSINLRETKLAHKLVFVYAGNMGVAQGMESLINLAQIMKYDDEIGFVFVGRGSEVGRLKKISNFYKLNNVLFFDEIERTETLALYRQCAAGLVVLDSRHSTNNIPGKWLSYLQAGLPTFAILNAGNDMTELIERHGLGQVSSSHTLNELKEKFIELKNQIQKDSEINIRCKHFGKNFFCPKKTIKNITEHFNLI